MRRQVFLVAALALFLLSGPSMAKADLASYNQNFESLGIGDGGALSGDGWLVFGNVFDTVGNGSGYLYGYGPFGAPNGGPGFSGIATGEAGANQGTQYVNIYSDYNNSDHSLGRLIEANVFQEQTIGATDVGSTYNFVFDYKANSSAAPGGSANTLAFIKVLDPNNGFATVYFDQLNTTAASTSVWSEGNIMSVTIDSAWAGGAQAHLLQFGFLAASRNFDPTGVFYDNLSFTNSIPEPGCAGLVGLAALGLTLRRRRT